MTNDQTAPADGDRRRRGRSVELPTIVEAAAQLFSDRGYQNVTMDDIADRLRIGKPTLYAYAKSKQHLLEGVFDGVVEAMDARLAALQDLPTAAEKLRGLMAEVPETGLGIRYHYRVFVRDERSLPAHLAAKYRRWADGVLAQIEGIIGLGQRRGEFDASLSPRVVAFALVAVTFWTAEWYSPDGPLPLSEVTESYADLFVRGLS